MPEPILVHAMRRKPTGTVEFHPADGPKSGTSTAGFLAEYDEAVKVEVTPKVQELVRLGRSMRASGQGLLATVIFDGLRDLGVEPDTVL